MTPPSTLPIPSPIRSALLLLAICASSCSVLEAQHMNAAGAPCGGVTAALDNCFAKAYRAADGRMNRMYNQIRQVLTPDQRQQLVDAQRIWVQLREATCRAESDLYKGGDAESPAYSACLEEETRQRTADLKTAYGWFMTNSK